MDILLDALIGTAQQKNIGLQIENYVFVMDLTFLRLKEKKNTSDIPLTKNLYVLPH